VLRITRSYALLWTVWPRASVVIVSRINTKRKKTGIPNLGDIMENTHGALDKVTVSEGMVEKFAKPIKQDAVLPIPEICLSDSQQMKWNGQHMQVWNRNVAPFVTSGAYASCRDALSAD
jgi:hypothetical protein